MTLADTPSPKPFWFDEDTFAFRNELVWEYHFNAATNSMRMAKNEPPPTYAHRCFVLARSARQFHSHARFAPELPVAEDFVYRKLIRAIVARNPRAVSAGDKRIVFPGFDCLRSFSGQREPLLKEECGGAWQSYVVRSHWRMILPTPGWHQQAMARALCRAFSKKATAVAHIFTFPQLTINHAALLFGFAETEAEIRFHAYDPNIPAHPTELVYDKSKRVFTFGRNHYWAGGGLSVVEAYKNWLY